MVDRSHATVAYINGGSDAVEGWLYRLDMVLWAVLDSIQKGIGAHGDHCEVGAYKGKALALLGIRTDQSHLFEDAPKYIDHLYMQCDYNWFLKVGHPPSPKTVLYFIE